ncbi:MAG TPA: glycine--tRNA ligase subunit beta, partial [Anaerolineae bacterium]|nr:glycine--tRNA ligase subunit beta [Anaerolineae bacterium]
SMRWLASAQVGKSVAAAAYSRPIRWLTALLGEHVIPFAYAGLNSGRITRGLRPEGSPDIEIPNAGAYRQLLGGNGITLDYEERRANIQAQLKAVAAEVDGLPLEDPALLDEVTNLVEQPTAFLGRFDEKHLQIPAPVLITVMKKHQRYFPVIQNSNEQSPPLLPYFIAVRNGGTQHLDKVRAGNEGVLIARYADAAFFFKADSAKKLEEFLPRLDTLTFQEKLGSMLDKAKRLEKLAPQIGAMLNLSDADQQTLKRAAHLCKADLATQMVVEFTGLQGTMGYEYARLSGETEAVASAIREHYQPAGAGDALPQSAPGIALSLANRLDSLIGLSAVGLLPSGSKDPFALRREALGLATILMQKGINFPVRAGLEKAAALIPVDVSAETLEQTAVFAQRRLEGLLREQGFSADVVAAALAERGDNPALAFEAAGDLQKAIAQENWDDLLNAYARCVRLVRKIEEELPVDPNLITEAAEKALYNAWRKTADALTPESRLADVLEMIAANLIAPINTFFDDVLVMVDDEVVRNNRLAL